MPLLQSTPPAEVAAAFAAGLEEFLSGPNGIVNPTFAGVPPNIPAAADIGTAFVEAQEVFVPSLADAANNTGVINPAPAGWQLFAGDVSSPNGQAVWGWVVQRPPSQAWKLIALYYGPLVQDEWKAFQVLSSLEEVQASNYGSRLLEIPGVNVKAFWLVAQTPGAIDYVIPIPVGASQVIGDLSGPGPFTMPVFLSAIRALAARNLTMAAGHGA
jgi:hypothetical protein